MTINVYFLREDRADRIRTVSNVIDPSKSKNKKLKVLLVIYYYRICFVFLITAAISELT